MSKINISFNDKNYNIEESKFSSASDALKSHLQTVMNGSGEVINLGGVSYNIDSTKLYSSRNEFVSHLGTIAGNGSKVSVGGVEYCIDSNKLSSAISDLGTVFSGLESGESGDSDSELNEYGFYYDMAYIGDVLGMGKTSLIFHEDGTVDVYVEGNLYQSTIVEYSEGAINVPALGASGTLNSNGTQLFVPSFDTTFVLQKKNAYGLYLEKPYVDEYGNAYVFFEDETVSYYNFGHKYKTYNVEYNNNTFYIPALDFIGTINSNGTKISFSDFEEGENFVLSDSYMYAEMEIYGGDYTYICMGSDGVFEWRVKVNDKTKSSYDVIKSELLGFPVTSMFNTFSDCTSLITAPVIPDGVTDIQQTFRRCTNITGNVEINANPTSYYHCFYDTTKPITITGSCSIETKQALASTANNGNVSYQEDVTGYATFTDGTRLTFEELKLEENGVKYGYDASKISDTSIGVQAFYECESLTSIDLPNVEYIDEEAFYGCVNLKTVNLPKCTFIYKLVFGECNSLTDVNVPNVIHLGNEAFARCKNLISIDLPKLNEINNRAFMDCYALETINLPTASFIYERAFINCKSLTKVCLPKVIQIQDDAFNCCDSLKSVDLLKQVHIGETVFCNGHMGTQDATFDTLILRSETMCDMAISAIVDTNIVTSQGMPTGNGFVYVPTALYESYVTDLIPKAIALGAANGIPLDEQTATHIVTAILRKIEDYPEICNPTPEDPEERLEGDGAEYYTLAPTALSFRSTAPLNELQEIQINGVTVDPSNYTLEEGSTIVTFPIDYLKKLNVGNYEVAVASDSKTVKGDFVVKAPELNEHGFYYNQPYSANLPMFGGDTAFFVRENGTYDIITVGKIPDTGEYTMDGNNIVASHPMLGTITCTISSNGTEIFCNELQVAFKLNNSTAIAADEDYVYVYMEDLGGYEVQRIDRTKSEYGAIKTGINGIDTVKLRVDMFVTYDNDNVAISNSTLLKTPIISEGVSIIGDYAFSGCRVITGIVMPGSITNIGSCVFNNCESLTDITFNGTMVQWNAIVKGENWNYNVPATYVQCSDGQVAL